MNNLTQPHMSLITFARLVIDALEASDSAYMVAGAMAVAAWAEARSTQDVDIVVDVSVENMGRLSQELEKRDMLVPHDIILDIFLETRVDLPVNAIHLYAGHKAELFLTRPGDEYREVALARRRLVDMGPPLGEVYVHAPEDLIINKLRYFKISGQPKHTRDIKSILFAMSDELDMDYIEEWVAHFGLEESWADVRKGTG